MTQLAVGQVWKTHNGYVIWIIGQEGTCEHPFFGSNEMIYTPEGRNLDAYTDTTPELINVFNRLHTLHERLFRMITREEPMDADVIRRVSELLEEK